MGFLMEELAKRSSRLESIRVSFAQRFLLRIAANAALRDLSVPQLLTASHIVPWSVDTENRTNPRNGLCLNAVLDKAFDYGLITVTPDYRVRVSSQLKTSGQSDEEIRRSLVVKYDGEKIALPDRFVPERGFLEYHNKEVFQDADV